MSECREGYSTFIPLKKVVAASIIDTYEDVGKSKEIYSHWAARGLRKLEKETIRGGIRKLLIEVNRNTMTATLPLDFKEEYFVGIIDENTGLKKPMYLNPYLTGKIETLGLVDRCNSCNQDKGVCESLTTIQSEELLDINGTSATKTTVKKLYPNGSYYLEETIPYYNFQTETVEYTVIKKHITDLDVLPCGCVKTTEENISKIKSCCPETYNCYYSGYSDACDTSLGSYKILEENGVIQLSYNFKYDFIYLEYIGFIQKVNGEYVVPEVAFETLVEWVKFKAISNKKNTPISERNWAFQNYVRERRNMEKILGRVSLEQILQSARRLPNFEITYKDSDKPKCLPTKSKNVTQVTTPICQSTSALCIVTSTSSTQKLVPFTLAVKVGESDIAPIEGTYTYTHPELVNALNVEYIIVDNNNESKKYGDFTFDSTTGTITRVNPFVGESVLIIPFAKYL